MALSNKLEAGKLRHRINIVQPSGTQDSFGGTAADPSSWTSVTICWASIESVTARYQAAVGHFVSETTHKITIRDPRKVVLTAAMQVWFKKRTFQIVAVLN